MKHIIPSEKAYHETMVAVYNLMNKGEANLSPKELKTLAAMVNAAEYYEDNVLVLELPKAPKKIL
jgi:HTH-type transcriptional regulator/antitoxin HigA